MVKLVYLQGHIDKMKLSTFKRLDKQNFDEKDQDLIDKLAFILNNDIQGIYDALNNKLSLGDNVLCTIKDVPIVVDENGIPKNAAQFQIDKTNMRVLGCQVINAINTTNSNTYPTGAPFINFTAGTQIVTIDHVTGLQPNQNYTLTIIAWGR